MTKVYIVDDPSELRTENIKLLYTFFFCAHFKNFGFWEYMNSSLGMIFKEGIWVIGRGLKNIVKWVE